MATNKIYIPTFISSVTYAPARVLPHIYFYNGKKASETYYIQGYFNGNTGSVVSQPVDAFPYFDNYEGQDPQSGSRSLLFFNEPAVYGTTPTGSLYTDYWETYVSLLYNPRTRLVNCEAIIPLADYFKMELNDIVEWRGNYYHLRAINEYKLSNGECNLQLLGPIIADTFASAESNTPTTTTTTTTIAVSPVVLVVTSSVTTTQSYVVGRAITPVTFTVKSDAYPTITLTSSNTQFTNLPSGINLAYSGSSVTLSGIPKIDGITTGSTLTCTVTSLDGATGSGSFQYIIVADAFTFAPSTASYIFAQNTPITPIQVNVTTNSGTPVLYFTSVNLPVGLYITATGSIQGTPLEAGSGSLSFIHFPHVCMPCTQPPSHDQLM